VFVWGAFSRCFVMHELPFQPTGGLFALSSDVERAKLEVDRRHSPPAERAAGRFQEIEPNGTVSMPTW